MAYSLAPCHRLPAEAHDRPRDYLPHGTHERTHALTSVHATVRPLAHQAQAAEAGQQLLVGRTRRQQGVGIRATGKACTVALTAQH